MPCQDDSGTVHIVGKPEGSETKRAVALAIGAYRGTTPSMARTGQFLVAGERFGDTQYYALSLGKDTMPVAECSVSQECHTANDSLRVRATIWMRASLWTY